MLYKDDKKVDSCDLIVQHKETIVILKTYDLIDFKAMKRDK